MGSNKSIQLTHAQLQESIVAEATMKHDPTATYNVLEIDTDYFMVKTELCNQESDNITLKQGSKKSECFKIRYILRQLTKISNSLKHLRKF